MRDDPRGSAGAEALRHDGLSISTNPNFRFTDGRGADNNLDVAITDTVFTAQSGPSRS